MNTHVTFNEVPAEIQKSLQWLVDIDDLDTVRTFTLSVFNNSPKDRPATWDFAAYYLHKAKAYKMARDFAAKTVELMPDSVEAKFNLSKCLLSAGDPFNAEKFIKEVIAARPNWIDPEIDLAQYVGLQGRHEEAHKSLLELQERVSPKDRNRLCIEFNLGWYKIRSGQFKEGLRSLQVGRELNIWGRRYNGLKTEILQRESDVRGKIVVIAGEGGIGDEIINMRFAKILKQRGAARIILWTDMKASKLFQTNPYIDEVVDSKKIAGVNHDLWAPCMDLPTTLDLDIIDILGEPYLKPPKAFLDKWNPRFSEEKKLKVGIRWKGNPRYEQDLMRAIPFKELLCFDRPEVQLYSFQKDEGIEELEINSGVIDLSKELVTLDDTAAALWNMDLIISTCTSVPHLAAAMGKKVWLLCPLNCYYIWATPGDQTPWYESMTLYRQERFADWSHPMNRMLVDFGNLINERKLR